MNSFPARFVLTRKVAAVLLFVGLFSFPLQAQAAGKIITGNIIELEVDERSCLWSPSWCGDLDINNGESTQGTEAADGNSTPVLVMIQLIRPNGVPITGLTTGDFFFNQIISPNGNVINKIDPVICPNCFIEQGDGVYRWVLRTANNWNDGTYFSQVQINPTGTNVTLYKMFSVTIP